MYSEGGHSESKFLGNFLVRWNFYLVEFLGYLVNEKNLYCAIKIKILPLKAKSLLQNVKNNQIFKYKAKIVFYIAVAFRFFEPNFL